MTDDLVQRVARLYEDKWGATDHGLARAAIALALEEAASYCEMKAKHYWGDGRDCCDAALQQTAAAIRALIPQEPV